MVFDYQQLSDHVEMCCRKFNKRGSVRQTASGCTRLLLRANGTRSEQRDSWLCYRISYKEAFHADVEQIFRKAAKSRSKIMDSVSEDIDDVKIKLKVASENLMYVQLHVPSLLVPLLTPHSMPGVLTTTTRRRSNSSWCGQRVKSKRCEVSSPT
jgi:hypothetical protein